MGKYGAEIALRRKLEKYISTQVYTQILEARTFSPALYPGNSVVVFASRTLQELLASSVATRLSLSIWGRVHPTLGTLTKHFFLKHDVYLYGQIQNTLKPGKANYGYVTIEIIQHRLNRKWVL